MLGEETDVDCFPGKSGWGHQLCDAFEAEIDHGCGGGYAVGGWSGDCRVARSFNFCDE
jgi:hypothetical protein